MNPGDEAGKDAEQNADGCEYGDKGQYADSRGKDHEG